MSIPWAKEVGSGKYSDLGSKNNIIPRGFAPRNDIIFAPSVWVFSLPYLLDSRYCHNVRAMGVRIPSKIIWWDIFSIKTQCVPGFGSHQMLLLMWSHHHHTRNVASGKMTWATTPERRLKECRLLWMPFASATAMSLRLDFETRESIDKEHLRLIVYLAIWC